VQEALGELVGAAQKGLMALSVGVGLGVLAELMEEEVTEVAGPRGRHDLGIERPRVRATDGSGEVALSVYRHFADADPLSRIVLERMLAGVSCRRYGRTGEPVGEEVEQGARGVSKSAISRSFIERTRQALGELMARRLDDVRLAVLMLDGIELKGRTNVVALGITSDGVKIPSAPGRARPRTPPWRPPSCRTWSSAASTRPRACSACSMAPRRCARPRATSSGSARRLAAELDRSHPGAAASLREGMAETLTLTRLGSPAGSSARSHRPTRSSR
jgi:hypothetical protein